MSKKKLLSLVLAGTISISTLFAPVLSAEAAPATVSEFDSLISELTAEQNELAEKLQKIQDNIEENEAEAEKLLAEMKATEELLAELRTEIEELKLNIEEREAHLAEQARALQVVGESGNVVNFVLEAESLSDIVGRLDVVTKVVSSNKQTIEQQENDKALVEEKEAETVLKQEEQADLAGQLEANKAKLEEQEAEQESLLAEVASEKAVAQSERDALVAQARAAEARRQELAAASAQASAASSSSNNQSVTVSTSSQKPAPAPSVSGGSVLGMAHSLKGIPYVYGGSTTRGFDCSGFTSYVFSRAGRSLPRTAAGQYSATSRVSRSQAQPGDLVFFSHGGGVSHVGIYLGGGNFIGAQTSTGVAVASFNSGYWAQRLVGFGR